MKKELKKKIFIFLTPKIWRWNKRSDFFYEIFWDLKEKPDGVDWGAFSSVENPIFSYENACRKMVETHDYNPLFDDKYGEMNLAKYFYKYQLQKREDSLGGVIERISPPKDIILKRSGTFKVYIYGREKGIPFNFQYEKKVRFWMYNEIRRLDFYRWIFCRQNL